MDSVTAAVSERISVALIIKGIRTWVAPDMSEKKIANGLSVLPSLWVWAREHTRLLATLLTYSRPPEAQWVPKHTLWIGHTSGHRTNVLFLTWSQSWAGPKAREGPWLPADVWTAPSWQACVRSDLVSIPGALGWGTLLHGIKGSTPKAQLMEGCIPNWGTPLFLVMSCRHSHSCASVSKNTECWSSLEMSAALCFILSLPGYSPPALQAPSTPGSLGTLWTLGNPNRVWARTAAGYPMAGSWVSQI